MKLNKVLVGNFMSVAIVQVANNFLPLLTVPYIARILGPDLYGQLSFSQSLVAYLTLVINYGFDLTATRDISLNIIQKERVDAIFSETIQTKFYLLIFSTVILLILTSLIPQLRELSTLIWCCYAVNFGFVIFPNWYFQGIEKLFLLSIFNLIVKAIFTLLVFVLLKNPSDIFNLPLSQSLAQLLVGLGAIYFIIIKFKVKFIIVSLKKIFEVLKNGFLIFGSLICINIYSISSIFILGFYVSKFEVGLYSSASRLIMVITSLILIPLNTTLLPYVSKKRISLNTSEFNGLVLKILVGLVILTSIISCAIFIFSNELISLVFGIDFIDAVPILAMLSILPLISGVSSLISTLTLSFKMDKTYFIITLFGSVFSILLNIIFIPSLGIRGVAVNWIITETLILISFIFVFISKINSLQKNVNRNNGS